jgi:endogenous inhibitor of DNA gyrase (YacG/DUF329 family)
VPRKRKIKVNCPICKKPVPRTAEDFPFCSERCRLIDLGKWASGRYVVSSPLRDIDESANMKDFPADED